MLKEFRDFVARGNLLEIAVAFIMGLAFAGVVTAFTNVALSFVAAIFGGNASFDELAFRVNGTPIPYGAFLTAVVNFLIVAWILFLVVKAYNRFKTEGPAANRACPRCTTQIPVAATRCPSCTSEVSPATA
jgi:large conductance mechanosensitive channel